MSEHDEIDDDDKTAYELQTVAWLCDKRGHKRSATTCRMAAAEVARLTAEVERLTPREMGHEQVCELLNKHQWLADRRVGDDLTWSVDHFGRFVNCPLDDSGRPRGNSDVLEFREAAWIAEGLLRDGGKGGAK